MIKTFTATGKKLKDGFQIDTSARGFHIIIDEPKEAGGTNVGMTPVEALLCALAACHNVVAFKFAPEFGVELKGFSTELAADLDSDGFDRVRPVRSGFSEIRYVMNFETDFPRERVQALAEFIGRHCPVQDNLQNGVNCVLSGINIK